HRSPEPSLPACTLPSLTLLATPPHLPSFPTRRSSDLPLERKQAFHTLQQRLNTVGYEQLMEEVAYTWFNRTIAIRYMEVNNYLPDRKSTRLNSSHVSTSYAVFCLKKKNSTVSGDGSEA